MKSHALTYSVRRSTSVYSIIQSRVSVDKCDHRFFAISSYCALTQSNRPVSSTELGRWMLITLPVTCYGLSLTTAFDSDKPRAMGIQCGEGILCYCNFFVWVTNQKYAFWNSMLTGGDILWRVHSAGVFETDRHTDRTAAAILRSARLCMRQRDNKWTFCKDVRNNQLCSLMATETYRTYRERSK